MIVAFTLAWVWVIQFLTHICRSFTEWNQNNQHALVVELVDTQAWGACPRDRVLVQI